MSNLTMHLHFVFGTIKGQTIKILRKKIILNEAKLKHFWVYFKLPVFLISERNLKQ